MVFASGQYGDFDIFLLDLATKRLSQLTPDQYWNDYPRLSPDARRVAFTSARGDRQEIRVMDLAVGDSRCVTPDLHFAASPCWSPDGKQLVFVSTPYFNADLFSVELESGKVLPCLTFYLGKKERVRKFQEATSQPLDSEAGQVLAEIIQEKLDTDQF